MVPAKENSWVHVLRAVSVHLFWKPWPVSRKTWLWKHALITETDQVNCICVYASDNVCCIYVPLNFPRTCHILVQIQICFFTCHYLSKLIYFTLRASHTNMSISIQHCSYPYTGQISVSQVWYHNWQHLHKHRTRDTCTVHACTNSQTCRQYAYTVRNLMTG